MLIDLLIVGVTLFMMVGLPIICFKRYMVKHNKGWNDPLLDRDQVPQTYEQQVALEQRLCKLAKRSAFMLKLAEISVTQMFVSTAFLIVKAALQHVVKWESSLGWDMITHLIILHMVILLIGGVGGIIIYKGFEVRAYRGGVDLEGAVELAQMAARESFKRSVLKATAGVDYASTEPMTGAASVAERYVLSVGGTFISKKVYSLIRICFYILNIVALFL